MKKLYLLLLVFLLLFTPATNAVTPYQLDHPIRELNGYTLREVFENRNMAMPDLTGKPELSPNTYRLFEIGVITLDYNIINGNYISNATGGQSFNSLSYVVEIGKQYTLSSIYVSGSSTSSYRVLIDGVFTSLDIIVNESITFIPMTSVIITVGHDSSQISNNFIFKIQLENGSTTTPYQVPTDGPYSDIDVGEFNLTTEQIDMYYDYYLEAVQFEIDYYEASLDPGEYQLIFKSIINGVKNLISEMGGVWKFLNAPIVSTNPDDFGFNVDWSWDLIGVVKQIFNNLAVIVLQVSFLIPTAIFNIFNIPVQISLLSLLFTNFVFVLLGWILVKSFII